MGTVAAALAGAAGGICVAFVALTGVVLSTRWKIAEENITKERAKWRDTVRNLVEQAVVETDAEKLRRIATGLALRMNPEVCPSKDDRELVALVYSLEEAENRTSETRDRITALAAHILKHDWDRAKWEADSWFWERSPPTQTKYTGPGSYTLPGSDEA